MPRQYWPSPKMRDFAPLAEPGVYAEILQIAESQGSVSVAELTSEDGGLRQRVKYRQFIETPTRTTIQGALSLFHRFGWFHKAGPGKFELTQDGREAGALANRDEKAFRRELAGQLHAVYVVPGWLVARLYALNPQRQGELVLPSPAKDWHPGKRDWEDSTWTADLENEALRSSTRANEFFPGSFPIEERQWVSEVKSSWNDLGNVKRKKVSIVSKNEENKDEKPRVSSFSVRARLAHAMRAAAINVLFASTVPGNEDPDFPTEKHPLPPRSFSAWCPRLDDLELIFYTDSHPAIWGRLLFPCGAFRGGGPESSFEELPEIRDLEGRSLWLHQPAWSALGAKFVDILHKAYNRVSRRIGAIYVSLLDVRDEVCRQLRLSSTKFDEFLERSYRESIHQPAKSTMPDGKGRIPSISLESDIRPEQQKSIMRRPVYIDDVPHSLIAMAQGSSGV